jgi:hypothetical protein
MEIKKKTLAQTIRFLGLFFLLMYILVDQILNYNFKYA